MYLINITVNKDMDPQLNAEMFPKHAAWFQSFAKAGNFLMLGPYTDTEHAGVIIAQAESRAALDKILEQDPYYPNHASYEVRTFDAKFISPIAADYTAK